MDGHTTQGSTGHCLESHDLAASKLVVHRDKDRDFVRVLLVERLIETEMLLHRVRLLPSPEETKQRIAKWIKATVNEI